VSQPLHQPEPFELEACFWRLYRDFFDKAEKKRRWSLSNDIPWNCCNPRLAPAVADVVESFCAVELYLPDYTSRILPVVRSSRGRTWFYANWGYEESKHSLALGDWLLRSGHRSDEQMTDLEINVFEREWNLPHDSRLGMLIYAMTQELATWLSYRNLRQRCQERGGCPALEQLLKFVAIDERAHYTFFKDCVEVYLQYDRDRTLEELRRVMHNFAMPAINDLADGRQRVLRIKELAIMDEDTYYREVYTPILEDLGVTRQEMRNRLPRKKSAPASLSD
jgi:acyl-[acyl-carrier-protein] desaturase